ncbi:MAG: iron ABC transporter permease [Acidimicrobiales bacterium]|nr:iron ABC transporter permease [Acidimicrobiales bacterium]MDP6901151.1 iron ABC transporter permease [Acidimicrobiales bacterium]HJM00048.1 iron ABC transporter permease [Acidimicrobiales bacterium]
MLSEKLRAPALFVGFVAILVAAGAGLLIGPAGIDKTAAIMELLDRMPFISIDSGLSQIQKNIIWEVRMPRVVLGALVGATLAVSGASYQAVFRNPLADPYLLGAAAGAGLGATVAIVTGSGDGIGTFDVVPLLAFLGALIAVALTYLLGYSSGTQRSPAALLLAGVAVASFLTAIQTFIQQQNVDTIRQVYSWILGRLNTASWDEVSLLAPYALVSTLLILMYRRTLDVMRLGDVEASSVGIRPQLVRLVVICAASLGTAAAVAVSGLIAFVGLIVPHTVRLLAGASNRIVLPLSILFGAAFLVLVDLLGRSLASPAEIPLGVITAFCGAPFFVIVLRSNKRTLG